MKKDSNIIKFLRFRELGALRFFRGYRVVLCRPNFNEDWWYYR